VKLNRFDPTKDLDRMQKSLTSTGGK